MLDKILTDTQKGLVTGAIITPFAHTGMEYATQAVVGYVPVARLLDAQGKTIVAVSPGNIINWTVSGLMVAYGQRKNRPRIKNIGLGWFATLSAIKLYELLGYLTVPYPINVRPIGQPVSYGVTSMGTRLPTQSQASTQTSVSKYTVS